MGFILVSSFMFLFSCLGFWQKNKTKNPPVPSPPQKISRDESESNCFFLRQRRDCSVSTKYTCYGKSVCMKLHGFSVPMGVYWGEQFRSNQKVESEMVWNDLFIQISLFFSLLCDSPYIQLRDCHSPDTGQVTSSTRIWRETSRSRMEIIAFFLVIVTNWNVVLAYMK